MVVLGEGAVSHERGTPVAQAPREAVPGWAGCGAAIDEGVEETSPVISRCGGVSG